MTEVIKENKEALLPQTNDILVFTNTFSITKHISPEIVGEIIGAEVRKEDIKEVKSSYAPWDDPINFFPEAIERFINERKGRPRVIIATTDIKAVTKEAFNSWGSEKGKNWETVPERKIGDIINKIKLTSEEIGATFYSGIEPDKILVKE
jgi:hypothetical protein